MADIASAAAAAPEPLLYQGANIAFDPYFDVLAEHASESRPGTSTARESAQTVDLVWKDLTFTVPAKGYPDGRRKIIDGLSGSAKAGQLVAIMGPSGSGKSSLANILAGRLTESKGAKISGSVSVNGLPRNFHTFKKQTAYVEQDDAIFAELTVREQITYAALLRLPAKMPKERKILRVEKVIEELGLAKCAETRVGNELVKGISGGERKRTAIGSELVTDSPLLFLDEYDLQSLVSPSSSAFHSS
jgi:ABC-type multidrug transport system ATPase subunit